MLKSTLRLLRFLFVLILCLDIYIFSVVPGTVLAGMVILQVLFSGYGFYKIRANDYNIFFFAEAELSKKNIVVREVWEELLTVSGCLLMIIPGLTSDILGILLFQHPVRQWAADLIFYEAP